MLMLHTSRIISSVFKTLQPCDQNLNDLSPCGWHKVVQVGKYTWKKFLTPLQIENLTTRQFLIDYACH